MRKGTELMEESGGEGLWLQQRMRRREKCEGSGRSRKYTVDGHD